MYVCTHSQKISRTRKRTDQTKQFFNIPILVVLRSDQWQILIIKAHFMAREVEVQRCKGELNKVKGGRGHKAPLRVFWSSPPSQIGIAAGRALCAAL